MASTHTKTDEVLASARKDLETQLAVVREQIERLAADELALTHAISSLDGGNPATSSAGAVSKRAAAPARKPQGSKGSARKGSRPRRRRRGASKSTADRVTELRELLAEGPKSRADLAAALGVSSARIQQLLAELGGSVSSQPDPAQRRGKLWSLRGTGNGAGTTKSASKGGSESAKADSRRKPSARRTKAAK